MSLILWGFMKPQPESTSASSGPNFPVSPGMCSPVSPLFSEEEPPTSRGERGEAQLTLRPVLPAPRSFGTPQRAFSPVPGAIVLLLPKAG